MKKRVFLVDDHPLVREWLTTLINQQADLTVCGEAGDGPEALKGVAAAKPDVAVVDLALGRMSGLELIKDLVRLCPNTAVLVLSMHEEVSPRELDSQLLAKQLQAQGAVVQADDVLHPDLAEFEPKANSAIRGQQA